MDAAGVGRKTREGGRACWEGREPGRPRSRRSQMVRDSAERPSSQAPERGMDLILVRSGSQYRVLSREPCDLVHVGLPWLSHRGWTVKGRKKQAHLEACFRPRPLETVLAMRLDGLVQALP